MESANLAAMVAVSEAEATATIRDAFNEGGELSAVVELRRLFPALADCENTRICAQTIASWEPHPPIPLKKPAKRRQQF
jgi:hypothetical protein